MEKVKQGVYAELDCLLDTRLALLHEILPDLVPHVLDNGYTTRIEDVFPPISKEDFKSFYDKRTKGLLTNALPTQCCRLVKEICSKLNEQAAISPKHAGAILYVDIYPYKLTDKEVGYLLRQLAKYLGGTTDIQIVDYGPERMTPLFCRESCGVVFMYDCGKWLDTHAANDNFRKNQIPDVSLFIPSIYFGRLPTDNELQELAGVNLTPFRAFEINSSPLINVCVIDTVAYCADMSLHAEIKDLV